MFRRPKFWILVVLLCAVGAWCVWQRSSRPAPRPSAPADLAALPSAPVTPGQPQTSPALAATNSSARSIADLSKRIEQYRLSNTTLKYGDLLQRDSALVLENARWDTTQPLALKIPAHLRAQGDPGTYIVKASGHIDENFRELLRRAGLSLVSYIPHDAWLVRGTESQVAAVTGQAGVSAVLPFEPYYKLKSVLLPMAVEREAIPAGTILNLVLFADARPATLRALSDLGATVLAEGPSPFGPVVTVQARPGSLVDLAQLSGVQIIERSGARVPVNDLSRVTLGVSVNTTTTNNYRGLTGTNVLVALTDSGVDITHDDLIGRVATNSLLSGIDTAGHGTHVAAIIAGDGKASAAMVPSNAPPGSVTNANFRGKAPGAKLYSMRLGEAPFADLGFDAYVQQQAATTNALISNNSWGESGVYDYNITAASYDAAVRDALPFQPGSQPVLFVFSVGNEGGAADNGLDGVAGSIHSPATSKNSISVGALEQLRNITNKVVINGFTNAVWQAGTDSDSEVASYSSRGNVGIGTEGDYGRVKPDVVAPGTFVVSARSAQWDEVAYYNITNYQTQVINNQTVAVNGLNQYSIFVPPQAVGLSITVTPLNLSTNNSQTNLPVYVRVADSPSTTVFDARATNQISIPPALPLTPGSGYFYAVGNPYLNRVSYSIRTVITVTNQLEDYFRVLKQLNNALGGKYRYESGTSMAAPAVSGVLALMQEFFESRLGRTNSPALMKALLINGARSASSIYDFQVQNTVNHQGWGLVNLPTSLPPTTNALSTNSSSFLFYDQSPTNALATGQSQTRSLTLNNNSQTRPLRVTLVWTDPPGNPAAGVKLVNDLDLVVTNKDTGEVYFGNDIPANSDFTSIANSNAAPVLDLINNVENVFISEPLGTNFSITVRGRRVNVNAVTAHTNDIVQDYALVISCGNGEVTNSFSVADAPIVTNTIPFVTTMTNTASTLPLPLFNQTVGANAPLLSGLNGMTNQWHFYVVTNYGTNVNFTNAAFLTFLPPTLATPRMGVRSSVPDEHSRPEADIDMYVSTNAALTNLDPVAIAGADKSLGRGGTETIAYSNSVPGMVYYVGVKSEDQMAGQYAFFYIFSDEPLSTKDSDGNFYLRGVPQPAVIPDGTPAKPGTAFVFGIATEPVQVRRVVVTNLMTHQNFGDLYGNLSHNNNFAVLHNHTFGNGLLNQLFVYDDSQQGDIVGSKKSDGPGSLQNFIGEEGVGQWMLTMLDDSPTSTGQVDRLVIKIEPQDLLGNGDVFTIQPGGWGYDFIEVPVGATNLMIGLEWVVPPTTTPLPVELYVRRGDFPDQTTYDKKTTVFPPGNPTNVLTITKFDLPPLQPGIYYIGIFNPNAIAQTVRLRAHIDIDLTGIVPVVFSSLYPVPLLDDAVTIDQIDVTSTQRVTTVEVGVALRHPRVSDLALQLVSPLGTRVLLFENRGGNDTNGLGSVTVTTNVLPAMTSGGPAANTNNVAVGGNQGTLIVNHTFFSIPDDMRVYYDGTLIYDTGLIPSINETFAVNFGPGVSSNLVIIMNEGNNADTNTTWEYTATVIQRLGSYVTFTEDTNKNPVLLKFALPPFAGSTTNILAWDGGFDDATAGGTPVVGQYFGGGWLVTAGSIDQLANGSFGLATDSGSHCIDINGNESGTITTNVATTPGASYTFSYAFTRNPDGFTPPQATILADGVPLVTLNPTISNPWPGLVWEHGSATFIATGTNTVMAIRSDLAGAYGVLLDSLKFTENRTTPVFLFPEEPLTAYKGEVARGAWKLEVWDSRVGATNLAPELSSWKLSFLFENNEALPIVLQHDVPVTNSIPPGQMQILVVDVPPWATAATNSLLFADLPLLVWFNQAVAPTGVNPPDTLFYGGAVTNGVVTLVTNGAPPLLPGQRYYLGIQNTNLATATYSFRVDFDITPLTNGLPYTAITTSNSIPRYFTYTVSSNATAVAFDLYGMNGNLNLVARQGAPLPDLLGYDYGSFNAGLTDEQILVLTNSAPVALRPGVWYLGVFNTTANPVNYTIRATEFTNALPTIITLTNAVAYTVFTNNAAPGTAEYYRYVVTPTAARVQFETFGSTGDFTLVAHKSLPLPDLFTFDYLSGNAGTNDELIVVFTNSAPVALTPGDWFVTAVKISSGQAAYNIMATEWNVTGQPITITNIDVSTGQFCITWNSLPGVHYVVQSTPVLNPITWTDASPTITAVGYTTTYCVPITGTMSYFRVIEGLASAPGALLPPTISSVQVTPGGVVLTWFGPVSATYHVEWTGALSPLPLTWTPVPTPVTSTNGIFTFTDDGSQTAPLGPLRFYRLTAP